MANSRRQKISPTTEQSFGQSVDRGNTMRFARENHTHGSPGDPTDSHLADANPHPQYLKKDQSTPETLTNGAPIFGEGLRFYTSPLLTPTEPGSATWNSDEDCLDIHATNQILQVGQELAPKFKNQTGAQIDNGTPVMFAGAVGASGRILIQKAIADGSIIADYIIGLATEDIASGADGHVAMFGKVRGIDTSGTPYGETWSDGDVLYVSPTTAGYLTKVKPNAPDLQITVAAVVKAHATVGTIFVRPTFEPNFTDLSDVNGTPLTADGQIVVWDNTNKYFDFNYNLLTFLAASIAGTTNQITVTDDGDGTVTLSLSSTLEVVQITPSGRLILPMGELGYFSTTGTTITISAISDGSTNMVVCNPTTALSGGEYEFDNGGSNNGRLRYTGATTKHFHVACTISVAPASSNDTFVFGIAKNGTVIAASKVLVEISGVSTIKSTAMHVMVNLATNDYLELYVGNITDTDNLTLHTLNIFAMGM